VHLGAAQLQTRIVRTMACISVCWAIWSRASRRVSRRNSSWSASATARRWTARSLC
jgi:hypothetical protein